MSQSERQQCPNIIDIFDKEYEHRTVHEHKRVIQFLSPYFPTISPKMTRFLSFFIEKVSGQLVLTSKAYGSQLLVIVVTHDDAHKMYTISRDQKISLSSNEYGLILSYSKYINCQILKDSSVEQQIQFMYRSQFLCSVPKKRLYQVLKKCDLLKMTISQLVYEEGQEIYPGQSGSGVYLVRKGDFGYFKFLSREEKQIQVLQFSKGHLFGTFQLSHWNHQKTNSFICQFTVKCKSAFSLIYRIPIEIFVSFIKPYCESIIKAKQIKLFKYINNRIQSIQKVRQSKKSFLSQTIDKGFYRSCESNKLNSMVGDYPLLRRPRLSLRQSQSNCILQQQSGKSKGQGIKLNNFLSLRNNQRSNLTQSEFKQFIRLERRKDKVCKLKQLTDTHNKCKLSREQIMFSFFKETWNFEKIKKKLAFNSNRFA